MRYLDPYPEYKKGQMYDPFKLGGRGYGTPRLGRVSGKESQWLTGAGKELGKEFSWLHGGRPLTMQEMQPLMATGGHDPRFGTIGGMPSIGAGPQAGAGTGYRPLRGFGPEIEKPGQPGTQPMFPFQEVGPTPAARRDVDTLAQLPYDLMGQYRRIADQGIYGPAGMHQIASTGILPSMERTKRTTTEALTHARAARRQTVQQGARMLAEKLGGKFASQPGLAMKIMSHEIIAPTLAREMEMAIDLKTNEMNTLNALQGALGDLVKTNQESKAMGLAGVQDIMGFLQKRWESRWWDASMENKFGWSPERTSAARYTAGEALMNLQQEFDLDKMQMDALWRDWLNEQQYIREEYGVPGAGPERLGEDVPRMFGG